MARRLTPLRLLAILALAAAFYALIVSGWLPSRSRSPHEAGFAVAPAGPRQVEARLWVTDAYGHRFDPCTCGVLVQARAAGGEWVALAHEDPAPFGPDRAWDRTLALGALCGELEFHGELQLPDGTAYPATQRATVAC